MPDNTLTDGTGQSMAALSGEQIEALSVAAIAAPSAENKHIFRLERHGDGLRLMALGEFRGASLRRRVLGLVSLGAVAENLELRGRRLGLRLSVRWNLSGGEVLAEIDCQPQAPAVDPLDGAIEDRHSNRRVLFRGPRMDPAAQARLSSEADAIPGTGVTWLDEPQLRKPALRLIRLAETERFRNEELHEELFSLIRFDVGWRASAAEGLPAGALELPVFERPAFKMLRHWSFQRAANLLGVHRFIGLRAADLPCRLAPHLCAITAEGDLEPAAVAAGRLLERVWLRATVQGLSVQVFAAAPLYALEGCTAIDPAFGARLAAGWQAISPGRRPFLVLRMGRAAPPTVRAGRPEPCRDSLQPERWST